MMNIKIKQQIMNLHYDRGLSPYLISQALNLDPITVKNIIEKENKENYF